MIEQEVGKKTKNIALLTLDEKSTRELLLWAAMEIHGK
jgi:hypothetical protein